MNSIWSLILLGSLITYHCLTTVSGEEAQKAVDASQPTFDQCKPFVEAALKTGSPTEGSEESVEDGGTEEQASSEDEDKPPDDGESNENDTTEDDSTPQEESKEETDATEESEEVAATEESEEDKTVEDASKEGEDNSQEGNTEENSEENTETEADKSDEQSAGNDESEEETASQQDEQASTESTENEATADIAEDSQEGEGDSGENKEDGESEEAESNEDTTEAQDSAEEAGGEKTSAEVDADASEQEDSTEEEGAKSEEDDKSTDGDSQEDSGEEAKSDGAVSSDVADETDKSESGESQEDQATQEDQSSAENTDSTETEAAMSAEEDQASDETTEDTSQEQGEGTESTEGSEETSAEEEQEVVEPYEPRSRDHLTQILGLDDSEQTKTTFNLLDKVTQSTLKELKSTYENAIKPLEHLYKYRDLSNRHFGDPEIFSKPLIVFMGPWSGGKSTIINWLLGIQHEENALRTGADPSPAQFNIMMHGKEPEKLDGTQLAADWTFSGLQKFGQSFLDRLSGQRLPNRLLEKVNIVEIPGILEVRKQVERSFPFNDACQWFIDRADTLFLIYDPAKLDIGPETEAILDQLKGRENQVRIVLNKADTVKPDELMRVQAMLVWNISPLMSSAEPPVMYAASLWDRPLQVESPKSLLVAHENNFLKDIRDGIERRVETRIAAARRFAVRVRNHAKMADCYLNTYNNHRSFFSDKKKISTDIIDHPQNYHIYEGLSTLTNISRYDLPDPDTYRDFFRLNPLWDFPTLQSTCSFWRGCPLHKLDIAIAYDLPEILGKFRRQREAIVTAKSTSKN